MAKNISQKDFENALRLLDRSAKQSSKDIKDSVEAVQDFAKANGLSQKNIIHLVKIASSGKFSIVISNALIHSLIPSENIPEEAVLCAISKITAGKCHLKVQFQMLRWIVLIFDIINTKSRIHCLYGILFSYINNDFLAPVICHVLFLLTRQQDVTHYRISRLMEQQRRVGNQPHINGLLSVYRLYQPSLIFMSSRTKAYFRRIDKDWKNSVFKIIMHYGPSSDSWFLPSVIPGRAPSKKNGAIVSVPKPSLINCDQTEMDQPISQVLMGQVHTSELKSFQDILNHVGNLRLPNQVSSLLSSKYLQHILAISPDTTLMDRLSMWIHHRLFEHLMETSGSMHKGDELLKMLSLYMDLFQRHLDVCESFLYRYLRTWNGRDHAEVILKFITKLPLVEYDILRDFVLSTLHKLFVLAPNVQYRCKIIDTLCNLSCNYIAVELPKYKSTVEVHERTRQQSIVVLDAESIIENLLKFTDRIITEGLQLEPDDLQFLYSSVQFWSNVTTTIQTRLCTVFHVPSFPIVYKALFSLSAPCLSEICVTLKNLTEIYTDLKAKKLIQDPGSPRVLNQYLNDFHNTLWRHSAFQPLCSKNSFAFRGLSLDHAKTLCTDPEELPPSSMFSIDKHAAMVICTAMYMEMLQVPSEHVLTSDYVLETSYMEHLESKGLNDIVMLLKMLTSKKES